MESDLTNVKEVYLCIHEDESIAPRCYDRIEQAKDFCRRNNGWSYITINH